MNISINNVTVPWEKPARDMQWGQAGVIISASSGDMHGQLLFRLKQHWLLFEEDRIVELTDMPEDVRVRLVDVEKIAIQIRNMT